MPKTLINTLVFAGREFVASLLDEGSLCQVLGPLDKEQIKAGPIGQFTYSRGQANLLITPDRINLQFPEREVFPDQFVAAAQILAQEVEQIRRGAALVTAVGLNCDTVFYSQEIEKDGTQFCHALTDTDFSQQFLKEQQVYASVVQFIFRVNSVQYNMRFEPDNGSRGRNLLLSINGHQDVTVKDNLPDKLSAISEVKAQIVLLHEQVFRSRGTSH